MKIPLTQISSDPRNANVCSPETLEKLQRSIEVHGICQPPLVRPQANKPEHYVIIDGHHRVQVAKALGWSEIDCLVKKVNKRDAAILLLTLNRLRGTDIPRKRAELIDSLLPSMGLDELVTLLPESRGEIEGLLGLLKQEEEALEKALKEQLAQEQASLPVPFGFMVTAEEAPIVTEALNHYQAESRQDQSVALVAMCQEVIRRAQKAG